MLKRQNAPDLCQHSQALRQVQPVSGYATFMRFPVQSGVPGNKKSNKLAKEVICGIQINMKLLKLEKKVCG